MRSLNQLDIAGKTLLIRVGYNVPIEGGGIKDGIRIRASLTTLRHVLAIVGGRTRTP
jgi:phosphoglycerate kinase